MAETITFRDGVLEALFEEISRAVKAEGAEHAAR